MFPYAISRGKFLDEYLAKEGKPFGPLHGLPVSLKEPFAVRGEQTTIGYISFLARAPAEENAALVDLLLSLGAIIYVRTNIPTTMMVGPPSSLLPQLLPGVRLTISWLQTADSENNIFGRTLNPHRQCLTAGGSSGGEGALIAMRGSILGFGTDIAGSVRIPSFCNGISGLRPTCGRIPMRGCLSPEREGRPGVQPCAGPMARSVRDLEMAMRVVVGAKPWDVDEGCLAAPWREFSAVARPLRFGLWLEDKAYPLHPPALRGMKAAVAALEKAGHEVVDIAEKIPTSDEAIFLVWKYYITDPKKVAMMNIMASGEPLIRSLLNARVAEMDGFVTDIDVLWDLNVQRTKMKASIRRLFVEMRLDAILMPVYPSTAPKHDVWAMPPYTVLANILDVSLTPMLSSFLGLKGWTSGDDGVDYSDCSATGQI